MHEPSHRRDFVRTLALGVSAGFVGRTASAGVDDVKPEEKKKDESPPPKTEVDARMEIVLTRYGKQLDDDARKAVRAEMEGIVRRADALRKFALTNGDGPFPVFTPYRAPLA
jgi:hypothetical protein